MSQPDQRFDINNIHLVISGRALDSILKSPQGDVMRDMMRKGEVLQQLAKHQIPLGHIHGGGGYGNLRDSVVKRVFADTAGGGMPRVVVGSGHPIALIHHEGTRPHLIRPRYKKVLRFPGHSRTGWVFAKLVRHPGTKPNRYLTDNLPRAMKA